MTHRKIAYLETALSKRKVIKKDMVKKEQTSLFNYYFGSFILAGKNNRGADLWGDFEELHFLNTIVTQKSIEIILILSLEML